MLHSNKATLRTAGAAAGSFDEDVVAGLDREGGAPFKRGGLTLAQQGLAAGFSGGTAVEAEG